jgi:hypothetical protein
MSFQNIRISCTGCSYEEFLVVRLITIVYTTSSGVKVEGQRDRGWCHGCNRVMDIESRPDLKALNNSASLLESSIAGRKKSISRLWSSDKIATEEAELWSLRAEVELWQSRSSGPRCLTCQSEAVEKLVFSDIGISRGFVHHCGKPLLRDEMDQDAPRFAYKPTIIYLDGEGNFVP